MIERNYYLNKLKDKMWNGLVKVIVGLKGVGKSYILFNIFKNYLLSIGVKEEFIITINLDENANKKYRNPDELSKFVYSKTNSHDKFYIFIDEVQLCEDFEAVLNEFLHKENFDVYVTGSNSKLLSKDIITEFRGRGDEINVSPLSFKEFFSQYNDDFDIAWQDYMTFGGVPFVLSLKNENQKNNYLKNLFKETYVKDLLEHNKFKNDLILEDLLNIISSSIGSLTNPLKLANAFKSINKINVTPNTIKLYLDALEDAFLIRKASRYDIKGKKYIRTPSKYYFTDIGLRNARLNFRQIEENHIMENIIFNELIIRGYSVDVGVVEINEKEANGSYKRKQLECDFIVNQFDKKFYIQSAYHIYDDEKRYQEKLSLLNIKDFFKKIIIVRDNVRKNFDENGILTISLKEFLLNDEIFNF